MSKITQTAGMKPCFNECMGADEITPMGATHGLFCDKEFHALETALNQVAEIIEHTSSLLLTSGGGEDRVDTTKEAPLPFNEQAFKDANELYGRLVYWVTHWATVLKRQAPGPAKHAWRQINGNIVGLPADVTPAEARYASSIMATWLIAHLEDICWQTPSDDVAYFHDEMADVFRVAARWPFAMQPRYANILCRHDQARIAVHPPIDVGDVPTIVCDLGHSFTEDEFIAEVQMVKVERDIAHKAGKVAARLAKKYAA